MFGIVFISCFGLKVKKGVKNHFFHVKLAVQVLFYAQARNRCAQACEQCAEAHV